MFDTGLACRACAESCCEPGSSLAEITSHHPVGGYSPWKMCLFYSSQISFPLQKDRKSCLWFHRALLVLEGNTEWTELTQGYCSIYLAFKFNRKLWLSKSLLHLMAEFQLESLHHSCAPDNNSFQYICSSQHGSKYLKILTSQIAQIFFNILLHFLVSWERNGY